MPASTGESYQWVGGPLGGSRELCGTAGSTRASACAFRGRAAGRYFQAERNRRLWVGSEGLQCGGGVWLKSMGHRKCQGAVSWEWGAGNGRCCGFGVRGKGRAQVYYLPTTE